MENGSSSYVVFIYMIFTVEMVMKFHCFLHVVCFAFSSTGLFLMDGSLFWLYNICTSPVFLIFVCVCACMYVCVCMLCVCDTFKGLLLWLDHNFALKEKKRPVVKCTCFWELQSQRRCSCWAALVLAAGMKTLTGKKSFANGLSQLETSQLQQALHWM